MKELETKVALVTGASRGIGRAIALKLASMGARVVINYRSSHEEAEKTASEIEKQTGAKPLLKAFDVSDNLVVKQSIEEIEELVGGIDILVNNAGVTHDALTLRLKAEDWNRVISANLSGSFFCSKCCVRGMLKRHWGRIINISSVAGEMGNSGQAAYVSAKAGMIGLTKALALEFASRQITVNAVTPGWIQTDMTMDLMEKSKEKIESEIPLGLIGDPSDVAEAVGFLASPRARYITGHVLAVNGGLYM